jgi:hypothetical protein
MAGVPGPLPRLSLTTFAALALLALARAAAGEGSPAGLILDAQPRDVVTRLFEKKVVLLENTGKGSVVEALVLFQQPRAKALDLLTQTARQSEFRPELAEVIEIERTPEGSIEEQRMKIMFVSVVYRLRYQVDPGAALIQWRLDDRFENDLRDVQGSWELFELDAGNTLGRFGTVVDVGPALPGMLQDWATRKNVPQTLDRTRRWVDSDGKWRP